MIDAAFDHVFVDLQPSPKIRFVPQVWESTSTDEDEWPEPAVDEFGGDPVYDTGS